jgi:hypothetical protein
MANTVRRAAGRVGRWWRAGTSEASEREIRQLKDRVKQLTNRVTELEADVQESRTLNLRVAELTDLIQELLVPIAARDQDKVAELLERYRDSI